MKIRAIRGSAVRARPKGRQGLRGASERGSGAKSAGMNGDDGHSREDGERTFRDVLDRAVDSGGWLLVVVGLFILLPVGVIYLASQSVKDVAPVRQARVEADILAPVNILAD